MSYHWTINGIPACASPITLDSRLRTVCAHRTLGSAEADIEACRALYPDFNYRVVEGGCDQPEDMHRYDFELGLRAAVSHAADPEDLHRRLVEAGLLRSLDEEARREAEIARQREARHEG